MKKLVAKVVCFFAGHRFLPGSIHCLRCHAERIATPITRVRL
jgi:hypothetical protein